MTAVEVGRTWWKRTVGLGLEKWVSFGTGRMEGILKTGTHLEHKAWEMRM